MHQATHQSTDSLEALQAVQSPVATISHHKRVSRSLLVLVAYESMYLQMERAV